MNVTAPDDRFYSAPADGGNVPVYLEDLMPEGADAPSVSDVREAVLASFSDAYEAWRNRGFAVLLPEYESCAYLTGRHVSVENLDGSPIAEGLVQGVDEQGRLLVQSAEGMIVALSSGEAHITDIAAPSESAN